MGGPLVAGYMFSQNFKVFNEKEKVRYAWGIAIMWTILVLTIAYFLPDKPNSSRFLLPLLNALIAHFIAQRILNKEITSFTNSGGQLFGWGRSLLVSLAGAAITVLVALPILFFIDIATDNTTSKTYGKIENEIAFDPNNISAHSVDSLADMLTKIDFFDDYDPKYIYVHKSGNTYELSIPVIDKEIVNDFEFDSTIRLMRADLQSLYPNHKIIFKIVVDDLDYVIKILE